MDEFDQGKAAHQMGITLLTAIGVIVLLAIVFGGPTA